MNPLSPSWLFSIELRKAYRMVLCLSLSLLLLLMANAPLLANEEHVPPSGTMHSFTQQPENIYGSRANYLVYRDKKLVGQHTLQFTHQTNEMTIQADSKLAVKLLGVTLYRYAYTATEVWSGGELVSVDTEIRDNRKPVVTINAASKGRFWEVSRNGKARSVPSPVQASNHWHPGALTGNRIYHTLHGRVYIDRPAAKGWERVVLEDGKAISARKFSYTTGFSADVWYDKEWRWIRLAFNADDGSEIVYSCESCGRK